MADTKEIRCINKEGQERWISEHLTKDREYMVQMGLTIQDLTVEKTHFEAKLQESKELEAGEDEFSTIEKESIQDLTVEKGEGKQKKTK